MLQRPYYLTHLKTAIGRSPVTALLGPRQCGKTTLAHQLAEHQNATFFDLESVPDRRRLQNPDVMLGSLTGLVVLDEIQEMPEIFQVLRILVDRTENQMRFLILGSASPEIPNLPQKHWQGGWNSLNYRGLTCLKLVQMPGNLSG